MPKTALFVAGIIFTLVTIAHAWRLYTGLDIVVDGTVVPGWASILGVAVAGLLALWMFSAMRRG